MVTLGRLIRPTTLAPLVGVALALGSAGPVAAQVHPVNFVTVFHSTTASPGTNVTSTADCPVGDLMVTGGAYWHRTGENGSALLSARLLSSAPASGATGWYATGRNASGESLDLTAVVKCLPKASVGTYTVKTREVTVDPKRSGNADLRCKSGQRVVAGGGVWHKPGVKPKPISGAHLSSAFPDGDGLGWSVAGRNDGAEILQLRVSTYCLPGTSIGGSYVLKTYQGPNGYGSKVENYLACDSGFLASGGGTLWGNQGYSGADLGSNMNSDTDNIIVSSVVTGDGTAWYGAGQNSDARSQNAIFWVNAVLCLPT